MTLLRCHEDLRQHHQNEKSVLQELQVCWMCRWTRMGWAKVPWCFIMYPRTTVPKISQNENTIYGRVAPALTLDIHHTYYSTFVLLLSVFHDKGEEGAAQGGSPWQDLCPAYRDFVAKDCQLDQAPSYMQLVTCSWRTSPCLTQDLNCLTHEATCLNGKPSPAISRQRLPKAMKAHSTQVPKSLNARSQIHPNVICIYIYYIYMSYNGCV